MNNKQCEELKARLKKRGIEVVTPVLTGNAIEANYVPPISNILNYWLDYGMVVVSVLKLDVPGKEYAVAVQNGINVSQAKAEESLRRAIKHANAQGYNITVSEIRPQLREEI